MMKRDSSEEHQPRRRKSVDMTERQKQRESGQLEEPQQQDPDHPARSQDLLETIGSEFERTIESGDPWESLTRNTKRLWRGLVD
ncbi:MAG: hypothetical protein EA415_03990 [Sphaerobacteraceae bacterium]|nr:MAG: hypothetical protein EA415_03990 [Sphaerobacteraceae bacterium]